MTPLRFSGFPFFGEFRAPGPLRADSSENFSTKRPVLVASRPPACSNGGTQVFFYPTFWRIPSCRFLSPTLVDIFSWHVEEQ